MKRYQYIRCYEIQMHNLHICTSSQLTVVSDRHHVHVGVVELNPGQLVAVRSEVDGLGVREDLLLVQVVTRKPEKMEDPRDEVV